MDKHKFGMISGIVAMVSSIVLIAIVLLSNSDFSFNDITGYVLLSMAGAYFFFINRKSSLNKSKDQD